MLEKTGVLRVFPSQANYVMAEIINGMTAKQITQRLLRDNILIKDLSEKIGGSRQFVRIAVRNTADNDSFIRSIESAVKGDNLN